MTKQIGLKVRRAASSVTRGMFERLEDRRLMAVGPIVTLTNGLPTGSADYFAVQVDAAGQTRDTTFGTVDTIYDYFGYLDLGSGAAYNLRTYATNGPTAQSDGSLLSSGTISPTSGGSVAYTVKSSLAAGTKAFVNVFSFTATGVDLRNAHFFQYMDADIQSVSDDVLKVDGTTAGTGSNKLVLTTIDPATDIRQAQSNGSVAVNSAMTGWGADLYSSLRTRITTGGYNPGSAGDIRSLGTTTVTGIGSVRGPGDITTALKYDFSSAASATLSTVLGIDTQAAVAPEIDVQGNSQSILSGDTSPTTTDFTDFGTVSVGSPLSQTFVVRNIGNQTLNLTSTPRIKISGANASDFVVTTDAAASIAGASTSNFIIRFTPSGTGLRKATVTIANNDSNEGTYTFSIQGTGQAAQNQPPVAKAGGPYTINEGSGLTLDGSQSSDPEGFALTYTWDINGDGTFGDATGASPTLSWAQLQALGINDGNATSTFNVKVKVSDGSLSTTSAAVLLTVKNVAPSVNAGADKSTTVGTAVSLTGTASDPAGAADPLSLSWVIKNSANAVVASGSGATIGFTPAAVGTYIATFTASDGDGGVSSDSATITVGSIVVNGPQITRFVLVDADMDVDLFTLTEGMTLNLAQLPRRLNVRAEGNSQTRSVRFNLDGANREVERAFPYALFSDLNGDYKPGTFAVGNRTLKATAFSLDQGQGASNTATLHFNVINTPVAATTAVVRLELYNTATNALIKVLNNYDTLNLATLPSTIGIRAITTGSPTEVKFSIDRIISSNANAALAVGRHTVTALPYLNSVLGASFALNIFVINQAV